MGLLSHWEEDVPFKYNIKHIISHYMYNIRHFRYYYKYRKYNKIRKLEKEDQIYPNIKISVGNMVYLGEGYMNNAIIKLETIVIIKNIYALQIVRSKEFKYNNSSINELEDIINSIKMEADRLISKYEK